ncbi:MAG TPA: hypothetical protein EYQ64_02500 [Gemmatimonadetes bacterium]|nr:hypothetical protein [Gemmatimonadota bacterium]
MVATDLDSRFTFDTFVVGPANRLAAAAAGMWRRALDLNPDNSTIRAKIDQLGAAAGT